MTEEELKNLKKKFYTKVSKDLTDKIIDMFGDEDNGIIWFYAPNKALGKKSPSQLYDEGKIKEIESILIRIEHGVYS